MESSVDGNARKESALKIFQKVTESFDLNVYKSIDVIGSMKTSPDKTNICLTKKEENNNTLCQMTTKVIGAKKNQAYYNANPTLRGGAIMAPPKAFLLWSLPD